MDQLTNWMLVSIGVITVFLAVVVPLVAYLNSAVNRTRSEIGDLRTHVAETYATKHDVRELGDRMERQMDKGFENLKTFLINTIKNKDAA